jgi:hypothetical protein
MRTAFSPISGMARQQRAALADEFSEASRTAVAEPVAVMRIGCRFPGDVFGPKGYWAFLVNGRDAVTEVHVDRWDADALYDPNPFAPVRRSLDRVQGMPEPGTAQEGLDAALGDLENREAELDIEQEADS